MDTGAATSVAPKSFASDTELGPTPPTLQLTTATGKAIKTYGLRTVHLHSQGLSLKVTFVIADVVTPLLGLDAILKDSLSLHVGQNFEHFLVNPVGERTKLEHMGKHLYLITLSISTWFVQLLPWQLVTSDWLSACRQGASDPEVSF